jgi:hypothetical protein
MSSNSKNTSLPPEEAYDTLLTEDQSQKLINIIKSHFNPSEILYNIRPELKDSYINRSKNYKELEKDKNTIIKIPLEKMNEEERLLNAYLSELNILNDIPHILSYINKLFFHLGNPNDKTTVSNILEIALTNYYSSKIKLYSEDANDSDKEFDEQLKEKIKNRKPLSEEEAKKELEELQSYPLFMTEMPKNPEENEHLNELQSLQYDGQPDEIALELLEQSINELNNYNLKKDFIHLRESMYDICNAIEHVENDISCDYIKFDLYYQRVKMQILVKNWRYAVDDLLNAIKFIPKMKKEDKEKKMNDGIIDNAYFLLIQSYIELNLFKKANLIINERINNNEVSNEKKKEYEKYSKKIEEIKEKLLNDLEKIEIFKNMENSKRLQLYDDLTSKGIKLKKELNHYIPPGAKAEIYKDENNKFHFPILIIYDEFNMTDYIQDFEEDRLIGDILEIIFEGGKLPWDKENRYSKSNCLLFYQCSNINNVTKDEDKFYYPMRNDESLINVLESKQIHMNGFPIVSVVSPMSYNFYEYFISKNVILKRKKNVSRKKYNK